MDADGFPIKIILKFQYNFNQKKKHLTGVSSSRSVFVPLGAILQKTDSFLPFQDADAFFQLPEKQAGFPYSDSP